MTKCSVPQCDRAAKSRGFCQAHYMRLWYTAEVSPDVPLQVRGRGIRERILERVTVVGDCWLWQGSTNRGYGMIRVGRTSSYVHRLMYVCEHGEIPSGLYLDHLCHTRDESCHGGIDCLHRRCCNPDHLEPVTGLENSQRGRAGDAARRRAAELTHCPRGHEWTPENLRYYKGQGRVCRECNRLRAAANREKKKRRL